MKFEKKNLISSWICCLVFSCEPDKCICKPDKCICELKPIYVLLRTSESLKN